MKTEKILGYALLVMLIIMALASKVEGVEVLMEDACQYEFLSNE